MLSSWLSQRRTLLPFHSPIDVDHLRMSRQAGLLARAVVHHFNSIRRRIPLDMQRLGSLLRAIVAGVGVEEVVVGLP